MSREESVAVTNSRGDQQSKVILKCADKTTIEVEHLLARMSPVLSGKLDEPNRDTSQPIVIQDDKVTADILDIVFHQWCSHHVNDPADVYDDDDDDELERYKNPEYLFNRRRRRRFTWIPEWDRQFLAAVDNSTLYSIIIAGHYLAIKRLVNICCKTVANRLRHMNNEELRAEFQAPIDDIPSIPPPDDDDEIQLVGIDQSRRG